MAQKQALLTRSFRKEVMFGFILLNLVGTFCLKSLKKEILKMLFEV